MTDYYKNGPEGMPRVKRMSDGTIDWVCNGSAASGLILDERGLKMLHAFAHAVAEETLARVPAWPTAAPAPASAQEGQGGLTDEQIMQIGLQFDLPAFRSAEYRASGGAKMTGPEQEDYDAQIAFARAILARQPSPVQGSVVQADEPCAYMLPSDIKSLAEHGYTTAFFSDVTNTTTGERSVPVYLRDAPQEQAASLCPICEAEPARNGGPCAVCFWKSAPAASRAAVPEGWKLVPVKATDEMWEAWENAKPRVLKKDTLPDGTDCRTELTKAGAGWEAMLAAAPSPAAQEGKALNGVKLEDLLGAASLYAQVYAAARCIHGWSHDAALIAAAESKEHGPEACTTVECLKGVLEEVLRVDGEDSAQVDAKGGEA